MHVADPIIHDQNATHKSAGVTISPYADRPLQTDMQITPMLHRSSQDPERGTNAR